MKIEKKHLPNIILCVIFLMFIFFIGIMNRPGIKTFVSAPFKDIQGTSGENRNIVSYEKNYLNKFYGKNNFLEFVGGFSNIAGKNSLNKVMKLGNGYVTRDAEAKSDFSKNAKKVVAFNKNHKILYVQAPIRYNQSNKIRPNGKRDFSGDNIKDYVSIIKKGRVDILDLNSKLTEQGISNNLTYFFKTDHHWHFEGSFWGYQQIVKKLNSDYDCNIPDMYIDMNNYEKEIYEDSFLGSIGKRTGYIFSGLDDISLIYPKFATNINLTVPSHNIYRQGNFYNVIFDMECMKKDYYNTSQYAVYTGRDYPEVIIQNENAPEDKSLLIVKDSFALPVMSFLSTCFKEIRVIDLRYYEDMSLNEYVEKNKPDITMFLYSIASNDKMFKFMP